jgi:hypothetical protein
VNANPKAATGQNGGPRFSSTFVKSQIRQESFTRKTLWFMLAGVMAVSAKEISAGGVSGRVAVVAKSCTVQRRNN